MGETSGTPVVHHDPRGPVSVVGDIPLDRVRDALGPGCWIEQGSTRSGLALVITTRADLADAMVAAGVPSVVVGSSSPAEAPAVDMDALGAWLQAFADGALLSGREADALAWMAAVRAEEERQQERARRERIAAEDATTAQLDRMAAHIAAMEASTSWRVARQMSAAKAAAVRRVRPPS